jgi:DNA repair protein RadD
VLVPRLKQLKAHLDTRAAVKAGYRAPCIVAPTGFGKSLTAVLFIQSALARGSQVLFLADREVLVTNARDKFADESIQSGLIMGDARMDLTHPVQCASAQTLVRRLDKLTALRPNVIFIDEAHRGLGASFRKIIAHYPDAILIGLTASPLLLGGRGLGKSVGGIFDQLVLTASVRELIEDGTLCPYRYYLPQLVDASKLHKQGGEYREDEAEALMDKPGIVKGFIEHWGNIGKGLPTLTYAVSVRRAADLAEAARGAGIRAVTISGDTPRAERDKLRADLKSGAVEMGVLCQLWTEGLDIPEIACIDIMAPTASLNRCMQRWGRGFRQCEGKTGLRIIDQVGDAGRIIDGLFYPKHGMPDDDREWLLEGLKKRKKSDTDKPRPLRQCLQCNATHDPAPKCPECGFIYPVAPRSGPEEIEGAIVEVTPQTPAMVAAARAAAEAKRKKQEVGMAGSREALEAIARARGYKKGWVDKMASFKQAQWNAKAAREASLAEAYGGLLEGAENG